MGLAIAYTLSKNSYCRRRSIVILEKESSFGQHSSSRNSEVIHAGVYYPSGSLKATLCVKGKQLLYEHCQKHAIPINRLGKYIVAQHNETGQLELLKQSAEANGVYDLQWIDKAQLRSYEPAIRAEAALLSPSTSIIDSHAYMLSLLHLAQDNGVQYAPQTEVVRVVPTDNGFTIDTGIGPSRLGQTYQFHCNAFVNSAGLYAQSLASKIETLSPAFIPELHLCKGDYFTYRGKSTIKRLVYPVPEAIASGLGIHATLDMSMQLRFGPDSEYVNAVNYSIDNSKAEHFAAAIAQYFPGISAADLIPAYSGIRPKLAQFGQPSGDFVIQDSSEHLIPGLIQLFGIESPGLTSSLAIGELVTAKIVRFLQ